MQVCALNTKKCNAYKIWIKELSTIQEVERK